MYCGFWICAIKLSIHTERYVITHIYTDTHRTMPTVVALTQYCLQNQANECKCKHKLHACDTLLIKAELNDKLNIRITK